MSMLSARLRFMLHVALIVYLHLCYRKFTAQSCLKVSAVAFSCEAALVSGYGFGYIVMKIDLRLLGLCFVPWVQGRLMLRLCGLMLRLGCRNNLFLLLGLCKAASGEDISTLNAGTQNVNMQNTRPSMCQVSDALMCVLVCVYVFEKNK